MAIIYIWSFRIINKTYSIPFTSLKIPSDSASIREGERLVRIEHCKLCHGDLFTGTLRHKFPYKGQLVAPNVTQLISSYSNDELELLIRHGIKRNKKSAFFMPSPMYYELEDEAVAKIIAYLRTLQPLPSPEDLPSGHIFYPLGRLELIKALYFQGKGFYKGAAEKIIHNAPQNYVTHDTSQLAFGRYMTMTVCSYCHGKELKGNSAGTTPDLIIAKAYTRDQFFHLLKTGEGALGRKDLGLMSIVAKNDLRHLSDKEMSAIYHFLKNRGQKQEPVTTIK